MESTLFFGNGINLLTEKKAKWEELLVSLSEIAGTKVVGLETKPYTMIYEELLSKSSIGEMAFKEHVIKWVADFKENDFYDQISSLKFTNYITTNYDLTLEKSFEKSFFEIENDQLEAIYSIRSKLNVLDNQGNCVSKIWHIHGDVNRVKSISLGLDHYCGSIGKIDRYIKGTYSFTRNKLPIQSKSIDSKLNKNENFDENSWIELFYCSNIHFLGFGFDYSETDIWWILNRRSRLKNIQNKIYFYGELDSHKVDLLKAFNVEYIEIKRDETLPNEGWLELYEKTIIEIKKRRL
jgi:hypothetical protein